MPRKKKPEFPEDIPIKPENIKIFTEVAEKHIPEEKIIKIEKKGRKKTERKKIAEKSPGRKNIELIITEKPAAAEKIAFALGKADKKNISGIPYYEINKENKKILIGCAVGHLFSLAQNEKASGWPIFNIGWKPNFKVKKKDWSKKYYLALQKLCSEADSFILACDYDTEGEVIGWNVIRFIAKRENAKRMKFSTLTADELKESYEKVLPEINFGQAYAGETRHKLDWFYGINLSRALMEAIKNAGAFKILSIGRVQGPTLHLIVEKEKAIQKFKPEPYWQVFLLINNNPKIEVKFPKDITKKADLKKFEELKGKEAIAVTTKKEQKIPPPAPFDLTTLQTEGYKFFNITPSKTLQIAQQLYLAGLISYPRTSSQKLPLSIQYKNILKKLEKNYAHLIKNAKKEKPTEGSKSDPAHPSIYPTGEYKTLEMEEKKIYELIVKRFISCFCNDAVIEDKKIEVSVNNLKFIARGLSVKENGWTEVYPAKMQEISLPDINGKIKILNVRIEEKQTQPPRRYTQASLISELSKRNLGTKCLAGETKIIFNGGTIMIKELFNKENARSKEKGIEIKKLDGKTISLNMKCEPVITSLTAISKRRLREDEKIVEIITDSSSIKLTDDHPLYLFKNNKIEISQVKNVTIKDKVVGILKDYQEGKEVIQINLFNERFRNNGIQIKHKFSSRTSKGILISKFPIKWSSSLAWVLGYYYGDGSYSDPKYNGSHQLYFTTTRKKALDLLKSNIQQIFGIEPYAYNLGTKYKINCNCTMSYALITAFPELKGKRPMDIPKEFIGYFLRGFFDADGNVHLRPLRKTTIKGINCNSFDTPRVKITLANKELILWVSNLLKELEIENKINPNKSSCKGKKFNCWTILISGRDKIEKFAYKIGFDSYKEDILYRGLKCDSWKYKILRNSAKISLLLNSCSLNLEELIKKTNFSRYEIIMALRRMFKLGIISKKRIGPNNWIYSLKNYHRDYLIYCMKLTYKKIVKDLYEIPIREIAQAAYASEVYDLSVEKESPNFITEGNLLVHNSTRSAIIDTLFLRGYVKGKSIEATPLGISLIDTLKKNSPIIIDEKLTRDFEKEMDSIQTAKKNLKEKSEKIIDNSKEMILKIEKEFRKNEDKIGKELLDSLRYSREQERKENTLMECPNCKKGSLRILYNKGSRRFFVACSAYPSCKTTFSLPPYGLMKPSIMEDDAGNRTNEKCPECGFPLMLAIKKGKRPWKFCFNPECPTRKK